MTDEQVLAALHADEREWFPAMGSRNAPHGNCIAREREWLCRLAEARLALAEYRRMLIARISVGVPCFEEIKRAVHHETE